MKLGYHMVLYLHTLLLHIMKKLKLNLAAQIFVALVLAIVAGLLLGNNAAFANAYIKPFGTIFLNLLKFIVCPIVLFSILAGMISMKDIKKVGSIGAKTIIYYLGTTAVAILIGLIMGQLCKGFFPTLATTDLVYEAKEATPFMQVLVDIFPSNFLAPLVNANMLQIIVIALLVGFGIILIGDKADGVRKGIEQLNEVFMKVMELILKLSPIGVFCLLAPVVAANGAMIVGSLAMVLLTAYISYAIHALVVYSTTVKVLGGMNPVTFFKGMVPAMIFAFSSASSVGTLPLNMECCEKLGADQEVTSFVLPLGATMHMDGSAMSAIIKVAFLFGIFGIFKIFLPCRQVCEVVHLQDARIILGEIEEVLSSRLQECVNLLQQFRLQRPCLFDFDFITIVTVL